MAAKFTSFVVVGTQVFAPGEEVPEGVTVDNPKVELDEPKKAPAAKRSAKS
jgi:hypothetical protein